jgi:hypothetical protein
VILAPTAMQRASPTLFPTRVPGPVLAGTNGQLTRVFAQKASLKGLDGSDAAEILDLRVVSVDAHRGKDLTHAAAAPGAPVR